MRRLLLDEHIPPALADALGPEVDAVPIALWHEGAYLGASDEDVVVRAFEEGRALVSFDVSTIPNLLREFAEAGRRHAGVLLVSAKSFSPTDVGPLARAIESACDRYEDLGGRVLFLAR